MARILLAVLFLLAAPSPQHSPTPDFPASDLTLTIVPAYQFAPGTVSYRAWITPHRDNIWFCIGWSSENAGIASRTSCQQLNGIYAPRVIYQEYRLLGAGTYQGFIDLYRVPNYRAATATQAFQILARED